MIAAAAGLATTGGSQGTAGELSGGTPERPAQPSAKGHARGRAHARPHAERRVRKLLAAPTPVAAAAAPAAFAPLGASRRCPWRLEAAPGGGERGGNVRVAAEGTRRHSGARAGSAAHRSSCRRGRAVVVRGGIGIGVGVSVGVGVGVGVGGADLGSGAAGSGGSGGSGAGGHGVGRVAHLQLAEQHAVAAAVGGEAHVARLAAQAATTAPERATGRGNSAVDEDGDHLADARMVGVGSLSSSQACARRLCARLCARLARRRTPAMKGLRDAGAHAGEFAHARRA